MQGYTKSQALASFYFQVFINFPSISKDQATKEIVLTLFHPVFSFKPVGVTIASHDKANSTLSFLH